MKLKEFTYHLPDELIAQSPLKNRTDSRLLVVHKTSKKLIDTTFIHLKEYLKKGDVLVLNDTAVLPARLIGIKKDTQAVIELLLLRQEADDVWECMVKKAKKVKVGTRISFGNDAIIATCIEEKEEGLRRFKMRYDGVFLEILDALGEMPLPPYIHERLEEKDRYQTVYNKHLGSAAAPTAGLHFTLDYLDALKAQGVQIAFVTLHVGLGTFRPVQVEDVKTHKMHEEYYTVSEETAQLINQAKNENRRVVAVGTTSLRTLETVANQDGTIEPLSGFSDLFIYPGYKFKCVDALLTNFHLPESTLLMLVSAFSSKEIIFHAYQHAIDERYRFFSFGDAMFLTDLDQ
ncbi:MAG: tRNA preQ1(34) S-adenosylmethionine ribosyltransferase-isomerase QueA [Candidatus Izemoplasmataceae bacterium]